MFNNEILEWELVAFFEVEPSPSYTAILYKGRMQLCAKPLSHL